MKRLVTILLLSAVASISAMAADFTGYVSDTKCAASNAKAGAASEWVKPAAFEACAKQCVKEGSAPVFVTADNKIVKIGPDAMEKVLPMLGHKVTLTGKIEGGTLVKVDSINSVKM
ncbi:MAG TPA: hypothetical protein VG273_07480 [Bryobacteraceae bacterium]|nr:hypothetical protein [Bryobacteraceae bacterium]